ncbi:transposable element Tc3 transposase [Trichonephila clavipes]|nr:transposable element Tc3 transposase [Trichonephila clavipes]
MVINEKGAIQGVKDNVGDTKPVPNMTKSQNPTENRYQGRSYHRISRINDTGPPSYKSPNMCNYSTTNNPLKDLRRSFDTRPNRTYYASDKHCIFAILLALKRDKKRCCQVIYSQFGLAIHQNDHQARRRFVEWAQNEIAVVPNFHKRILFSDEAHFWLNGYVNKQNCRIWSEANPQVYVETPLHPEKLTKLWFQQDDATCHTARATIDLLKDTFGDRLISRFGTVNWPPRSCDLTPLDYFLWGYVKSLVYADKPQTLDHLEDNIRRVIADIRPQILEKVIENWTSRLDYIRASRASPMPEIIFKM